MPIPTIKGLKPYPEFSDVTQKINQLVNELTNLLLNLDSLNVVSLTADNVDAGTINAGKVKIRVDYETGAYILLDSTGMTINNGTADTFKVTTGGKVTMTGAEVRSSAAYPKVVLSSESDMIAAYTSEENYTGLLDSGLGAPHLYSSNPVHNAFWMLLLGQLTISTTGSMSLSAVGDIKVKNWAKLLNNDSGQTLQQSLDTLSSSISGLASTVSGLSAAMSSKATSGSSTSTHTQPNHNHGIPDGAQLLGADGETVYTFSASGGFSHSHSQN